MAKEIKFLGVSSGICAPAWRGKLGAEKGYKKIVDYKKNDIIKNGKNAKEIVGLNHLYKYVANNVDVFIKDMKPRSNSGGFTEELNNEIIKKLNELCKGNLKKLKANQVELLFDYIYGYLERKGKEIEATDNSNLEPAPTEAFARHIKYLDSIFSIMKEKISSTLEKGKFPFIIAGDHSASAGTLAGIKKYIKDRGQGEKLAVIWIDAHADAHTPFSTPSGNMHGMPLGMALGLDKDFSESNNDNRRSKISFLEDWNNLIINLEYKIEPRDLAFIGIRSFEKHETKLIEENNVKHFYLKPPDKTILPFKNDEELLIKNNFPKSKKDGYNYKFVCNDIYKYFENYDYIYVSFDVDVISKKQMKATGTPSVNGLTVKQSKEILEYFWKTQYNKTGPKLIGMDIVEYIPDLDKNEKCLKSIYKIIESLYKINASN